MIAAEIGAMLIEKLREKFSFIYRYRQGYRNRGDNVYADERRSIWLEDGRKKEEVVGTIRAHHNDVDTQTVEAVIVKAADAISAARPGARRESFESYIKRLDNLEKIADSIEGVEKSFAIQAGRELRVMAKSDIVDDIQAKQIARDIAKRIEDELKYPGIIRVTVIRETRAVEVAR